MRKTKYTITQIDNETTNVRHQVMNKYKKAPWMYMPIGVLSELLFPAKMAGVTTAEARINDKVINLITIIQ